MEAPDIGSKITELIASQLAAGTVPNLIRQPIRVTQRAVPGNLRRQGGPDGGSTFAQEMASKFLPLPSLMPPQALDYDGKPIYRSSVWSNATADFMTRLLMPVQVREAPSFGNENRMLWNYFRDRPNERMPEMPRDEITYNKEKYRMTPAEYRDFTARRAELIPVMMAAAGDQPNCDEPTKDDIEAYRRAGARATEQTRKELIQRWVEEGRGT
jgi:hypothetical protein